MAARRPAEVRQIILSQRRAKDELVCDGPNLGRGVFRSQSGTPEEEFGRGRQPRR